MKIDKKKLLHDLVLSINLDKNTPEFTDGEYYEKKAMEILSDPEKLKQYLTED